MYKLERAQVALVIPMMHVVRFNTLVSEEPLIHSIG